MLVSLHNLYDFKFFAVQHLSKRGETIEAHAFLTTDMIYVQETPTISDMYVTNVVGPTQGVSALSHGSQRSGNGQRLAISVMEAQSPALPIKSKTTFPPLPTSMYKDWRMH